MWLYDLPNWTKLNLNQLVSLEIRIESTEDNRQDSDGLYAYLDGEHIEILTLNHFKEIYDGDNVSLIDEIPLGEYKQFFYMIMEKLFEEMLRDKSSLSFKVDVLDPLLKVLLLRLRGLIKTELISDESRLQVLEPPMGRWR